MDGLIGFLIFVGIVIVSVVSRVNEMRKAEEERQRDKMPPLSPSDMPESTRRMIFGDGTDIPTARPRQAPPPVVVARPRTIVVEEHEGPAHRPAPPPGPVPARKIPVPQAARPVPPPRPAQRPATTPPVVVVRGGAQRQAQPPPRRPAAPMPAGREDAAELMRDEAQWVRQQEEMRRREAERLRRQAAAEARRRMAMARRHSVHAVLHGGPVSLRQAVLLREVLGPPMGIAAPGEIGGGHPGYL